MTRVLVLGAGGMLGQAVTRRLASAEVEAWGRARLNVEARDALVAGIADFKPDLIVNCAAHTDLEAAERDPTEDRRANALLPEMVADAALSTGALLIHMSSTGCYGDWKSEPYAESDALQPTSAHHKAKKAGEDAVIASGCRHLIVRTGWLYGGAPTDKKNFVWKRLLEARDAERMTSDASQRGCPTFVDDLADQMLALAEAGGAGVFNITAHGAASRYEYVREIVEAAGLPCRVEPGPAFQRLARISPNETSVNARLSALGLDRMADWTKSLRRYVAFLVGAPEWRRLAAT